MVLKFLIIPLCFLIHQSAIGQTQKAKIEFSSVNQLGLLTGSAGEAFMIETINGVRKGEWFTGIGLGLDYYKDRTIPLFLDVRRDLLKRKNTPFVYADGGINFRWLKQGQSGQFFNGTRYSTPAGWRYDVGLGWKLSGKNSGGLIFSAGYSFKQVKEIYKYNWGAPTPQLQEQNTERYNYLYRRLVFKLGLML